MKEKYNRRQFLGYAGIGSITASGLLVSGCQQKETVQEALEEKNKALIRHFIEELDKQNFTIYDEVFTPDVVIHSGGITITSMEEAKRMAPAFYKAFPDFHHVLEDLIAEGDKVVVRATNYGTHEGEFMGIPPTGKKVSYDVMGIYCIKDGKIIECWVVYDMLGLMQQLGAVPPIGE